MGEKETAEDSRSFELRMKRKSSHILAMEARVLEKRQEVDRTARRQVEEKRTLLSGNFSGKFRTSFKFAKNYDQLNRPSDQQFPVHTSCCSRQDDEVWRRPEIRRWFDAYSTPQTANVFDQLASSYNVHKTSGR